MGEAEGEGEGEETTKEANQTHCIHATGTKIFRKNAGISAFLV